MCILCHLAEFESEFLLSRVVEITAEKSSFVRSFVLPTVTIWALFAIVGKLLGIEDEKVDFSNYDQVGQWVLGRDRVLLVVAGLEDLLAWNLEYLEKDLNQIWSVEVMKVLLAKVCLVSRLHPRNDHALASLRGVLDQAAERAI